MMQESSNFFDMELNHILSAMRRSRRIEATKTLPYYDIISDALLEISESSSEYAPHQSVQSLLNI